MHPILFTIKIFGNSFPIGTYGVLMVIALAVGAGVSIVVARRYGYRPAEFWNYCLPALAGLIGGALLAGSLVFLPERIGRGHIDYPLALVSWGGILGILTSLLFMAVKWRLRFLRLADIFTPGSLIGMGIGRIGCFFAGCCYGVQTSSPLGITFTDPIAPASAVRQPLAPVQLISAAFLLVAGLVFLRAVYPRRREGLVFAVSAMAYSLFRFTVEYWRADPRLFALGMSDGQWFSIGYFMLGFGIVIYLFLKRPHPPLSHGRGGIIVYTNGGLDTWNNN
ncbi:MAG: prolipoprotein diacylglyceryl transferase [Spirochaetes bacterium]|nr:prolipoprotein diacylglyceryl transferase [Spirochaetota bacterium]